ncbi:MAG: histidinol-phosphate transaminase [Cyclobacteriaceae bacterium]|nr:histidinol-phosphate transaminase [Cyclobacteriaceae bacterium]
MDITQLVRPNISKLKPYSSARDDFKGSASVYLDANENPYPSDFNRYPDPHQQKLKTKIAAIKNIPTENIFVGNGSDEPIDLLFRAFCEPGIDNVLIPEPTYGMYTVSANINNIAIKNISLTPDFDLDVEAISKALDKNTKLLFLCSPNNPSGNLLSEEKINQLLHAFPGLVVVDEAYIDFTKRLGFLAKINDYSNLVVLQTLSKAWGMASLRIGMCFAPPEIIQVLNKIKPPYNISGINQQLAEQALNDVARKEKNVQEIIAQREWLKKELNQLPSVHQVYPSEANFLLVKIAGAREKYQQLIRTGVVVRDRSSVILCQDCLRITVGTPSENQQLITSLEKLE